MVKKEKEGSASQGQPENGDAIQNLYHLAEKKYAHFEGTRRRWYLLSSILIVFLLLLTLGILLQLNYLRGESQADQRQVQLVVGMVLGAFSSAGSPSAVGIVVDQNDIQLQESSSNNLENNLQLQSAILPAPALFLPFLSSGPRTCTLKDDILFEVVSGPLLTPPIGSKYPSNKVPNIQASWTVRNAGNCSWETVQLYSLKNGAMLSPELSLDDQAISLIPGQSQVSPFQLLEVSIPFKPEEAERAEYEWVMVINGRQLFTLSHLALDIKNWVVVTRPDNQNASGGNSIPAEPGTTNQGGETPPDRGSTTSPPTRATEAPPQRP
jgi:hypothetical protein